MTQESVFGKAVAQIFPSGTSDQGASEDEKFAAWPMHQKPILESFSVYVLRRLK